MCLLYCRLFSVPGFHQRNPCLHAAYNKYFQNRYKWQNPWLLVNNNIVYVIPYSSSPTTVTTIHILLLRNRS